MKITNIKKIILKNKKVLIIENFDNNTLDFVAKTVSNSPYLVVYNPNDNDKIALLNATNLRQICSLYDSLLFIKKRADITKLSKADGILLDESSIDIEKVKQILDEDILFGYILSDAPEFDLKAIEKFDLVATSFNQKTLKKELLASLKSNIPYFIYENEKEIILE